MSTSASADDVRWAVERLRALDAQPHVIHGEERVVITAQGSQVSDAVLVDLRAYPGVQRVDRASTPYKLAGRLFHQADSSVTIGSRRAGGGSFLVAAGHPVRPADPCCLEVARQAAAAGAGVLWVGAAARYLENRGRTGAYLMTLARLREEVGLPLVVDLETESELALLEGLADALHLGPAHMGDSTLLRAAATAGLPLILSRAPSATITEWLMRADTAMSRGNFDVLLCEEGIRTFETSLTFTLDLGAVAAIKRLSHLPVVVNPGHAVGREDLVPSMALAAAAAGADGVVLEVHQRRHDDATTPGHSLPLGRFTALMGELQQVLCATT